MAIKQQNNMCLYPKLIKNKKYTVNKKNGGNVPVCHDERLLKVAVGCGKCIECCKQKARGWQVRLLEDIKKNKIGHFVTLTFSDEHYYKLIQGQDTNGKQIDKKINLSGYELDNVIAKIAVRRFLERWRKKYKRSVRHWLITELGHNGTENIHLHGILWTDKSKKEIEEIWQYGHIWAGYNGKATYINEKTVNYITKYVTKIDSDHKEYNPKILSSQGIGANYMERTDYEKNKFKGKLTDETYKTSTGHKIALPIYWRNKIYSEKEREKLWLQKLDEEQRFVMGEKVDISKGEENYFKLLEWYRMKNKRLGYGDDKINWDKKRYEKELRNIKQATRIAKAKKKLLKP